MVMIQQAFNSQKVDPKLSLAFFLEMRDLIFPAIFSPLFSFLLLEMTPVRQVHDLSKEMVDCSSSQIASHHLIGRMRSINDEIGDLLNRLTAQDVDSEDLQRFDGSRDTSFPLSRPSLVTSSSEISGSKPAPGDGGDGGRSFDDSSRVGTANSNLKRTFSSDGDGAGWRPNVSNLSGSVCPTSRNFQPCISLRSLLTESLYLVSL